MAALCLGLIGLGFGTLANYSYTPGTLAAVPRQWPSAPFALDAVRPTAVLFVHPQCSCSAATFTELERALARNPDAVALRIVMLATPEVNAAGPSEHRARAAALPGALVHDDVDGTVAQRFGATTSGFVAVFGPDGRLRFSGGITAGRGHEGDNAGSSSLRAIATGATPADDATPTFGCDLFDAPAEPQR